MATLPANVTHVAHPRRAAQPSQSIMSACNSYANDQVSSKTEEVLTSAALGAALGAAVGAAGGAIAGGGKGAGAGANGAGGERAGRCVFAGGVAAAVLRCGRAGVLSAEADRVVWSGARDVI